MTSTAPKSDHQARKEARILGLLRQIGRSTAPALFAVVIRRTEYFERRDQRFFNVDLLALVAEGRVALTWDEAGNSYYAAA